MNVFDIAIVLILIMFLIVGFKNGVVKEAVSLIGIVIVFVISFLFKEQLGNILCKYLPFFDLGGSLEGVVSINILIYQLIAFLIIFSILLSVYVVLLKISGILQKLVNLTLVLLLPSQLGGAVISFLKGYIITFAVLLVLAIPLKDNEIFNNSKLIPKIVYETPILSSSTGNITNSISEIYTLGDRLSKGELTTNDANIETIDIMLEYKVVSKKTVEQLVVLDKLKGIDGVDGIIEKYE